MKNKTDDLIKALYMKNISEWAHVAKVLDEINKKIIDFLDHPEPGKILDIEGFIKLEHLDNLKVSWFTYITGETKIYQMSH